MKKQLFGYSVAASIMTIIFFVIMNRLISAEHIWFIYPAYAVLWWPVSIYFSGKKSAKGMSVAGSGLTILFITITNIITSPEYPWFLYVVFPIIWWPLTLFLGRKAGTVKFALQSSFCVILYYTALNFLLSPGYPWAIYPAFAVLWWPLSLYFAYKNSHFVYSVISSLYLILFFIVVNWISSAGVIWAIYPIFAVLWWPLSVYYFVHLKRRTIK